MVQTERMIWLDALRLIAGVSMVGLHSTSDATGQPFPDATPGERIFPLIFRMVVYTARTELFLIISIFLLLMALERRPRGYWTTIKEQMRRLLVPYAFWTVFFAFYGLIKAYSFGYQADLWSDLQNPMVWLGYFVLGDVKYHMHFIPTLFGLLLFYPLFLAAIRAPWLALLVLFCLAIKREADVFMWANIAWMPGFDFLLRAVKILTYCSYGLVAGALWGIYKRLPVLTHLKQWLALVCYVGILLLIIKAIYTYRVATLGDWQYNFTPAFWADFLMPIALFAAVMLCAQRPWPAIISSLAPYSFGIYLSHPVFLDLYESLTVSLNLSPTLYVSFKALFGLVFTSLLVAALHRTRLLAWTIGLGKLPYFEQPIFSKPLNPSNT